MKMTSELLLPTEPGGVDDTQLLELSAEKAAEIDRLAVGFRQRSEQIAADARFSAAGKVMEKSTAAQQVVQAMAAAVLPAVELLRGAIKLQEGELLAPQVRHRLPENMERDSARDAENWARSELMKLEPLERMAKYREAIALNDVVTIRAVELTPASFRLVDAAEIEHGAVAWAERHMPAEYRLLEQRRSTLYHLESVASTGATRIAKLTGIKVGEDPIEAMAAPAPPPEG